MADIIGTISGIIELVGTAKKLKDFFDNVRDAPDNVTHFARHAESLSVQCSAIAAHANANTFASLDNRTLDESLRLCEAAAVSLRSVVHDLEVKIGKHRKRGAFLAALKEDVLETHRSRLRDAEASLQIAYAIFAK